MRTYPDATAVFDIDSVGLINFIQGMNRGVDFSGKSIGGKTALFVGAGCNPGAVDMHHEAERFGPEGRGRSRVLLLAASVRPRHAGAIPD